jgi:nucleoside-diphosphate-sugar epimerase
LFKHKIFTKAKKEMRRIDPQKPVLVTGGSGYMASWIVKYLLDEGYTVHTTVRNLNDQSKIQHLSAIQHHAPGTLKIFEADLLTDGSFDEAIKGCELVIHTASPFQLTGIKDANKELIEPALQGVRNVFFAANETGTVKRIVLTSSIVALVGDTIEIRDLPQARVDEKCWNTSSSPDHQPYPFSKTIAEKEAWKLTGQMNSFDLVVINPGLIFGPSLSKRIDSTSINLMIQLLSGKFRTGVPTGAQAVVDVRDIARAHIRAGFTPEASGRHLVAAELKDFLDIANIIRTQYPAYPLPKKHVPKWLFKLIAPLMGYTRKFVDRNMGYDFNFDNTYAVRDLNIRFTPFVQTVTDHLNQLVKDKLVADNR